MLPNRYSIKENGKGPFLTCIESPNINVIIDRDFCVTSASAKKYPEGSIFLDGAAKGEPFLDVQKKIYNLDHHEGCVRAFTLSTCEQALVLILKGLDLGVGDWCIYANEPDLDTILAIWLILNHMRVGDEDPEIRNELMPLLRLQGIIDSHGFEMKEFTGFPEDLQQETLTKIEYLRESELDFKKTGKWNSMDEREYVSMVLRTIDEMVYSSRHFDGIGHIEELFRLKIGEEKIAICCKSEEGIYETEEKLKKTHGSRLGLIFLQKSPSTYTVRQVDPFLPTNLSRLYDRLNILDPAATASSSWAGSEEIGGSPRGSGTALDINTIKKICSWVYNKQSMSERFKSFLWAFSLAAVTLAVAFLGSHILFISNGKWQLDIATQSKAILSFNTIVALMSFGFILFDRRHKAKYYGFGAIRGYYWLLFLPVTSLASMFNGAIPRLPFPAESPVFIASLLLSGSLAWELLFRGAVHGILVESLYSMRQGGKWFLSGPNAISSALSVLAMGLIFKCAPELSQLIPFSIPICLLATFIAGLGYGIARERSQSVFSSVVLNLLSLTFVAFLSQFII